MDEVAQIHPQHWLTAQESEAHAAQVRELVNELDRLVSVQLASNVREEAVCTAEIASIRDVVRDAQWARFAAQARADDPHCTPSDLPPLSRLHRAGPVA